MFMNKYLAEFIGTFFLVLTIGCTGIGAGASVIAPLAIGAALMVMVFAGGHISGAHYNPAVTLGVLIRGKVKAADAIPYIIAQIAGAALAALIVSKFLRAGIAVTPIAPKIGPALLAEFLFTFALVYVVLNAATAEGTSGNSFYGLAIGMTVMTGAFAVGDISGGAFNPAVAVAISMLGISPWSNLWIYLAADFGAAVVAAIVFLLINSPAKPRRSLRTNRPTKPRGKVPPSTTSACLAHGPKNPVCSLRIRSGAEAWATRPAVREQTARFSGDAPMFGVLKTIDYECADQLTHRVIRIGIT
jgi:Glycerol uptake facilitator and related permeases (Major Intrinsic Protein Family)